MKDPEHSAKEQREPTILEEAETAVNGPRERDYDHPATNFQRVADLWNIILNKKLSIRIGEAYGITKEDVALMMIALKLARSVHKITRDNLVDIAGYARCVERFDEPLSEGVALAP